MIACGSYRRGCTESSDVDLLLSHRDGVSHKGTNLRGSFIQQLINNLRRCGIVTRELMEERKAPKDYSLPTAQHGRWQQEGYATWKGCFKVEQLDRRVDLLVVPYARIAPALIYFTGSGLLCRQMRGQAMKMGLRLNEKALVDMRTGDEIHVKTERDVFERLGMQYIEPRERDNVTMGFHYTKADRAKQLAADSQPLSVGNTAPKTAASRSAAAQANPVLSGIAPRRRLYLVGDHNMMSPERCDGVAYHRLPAMHCIGKLLQQEACTKQDLVGDIEVRVWLVKTSLCYSTHRFYRNGMQVVLDDAGYPPHCTVGLQTQQAVRMLSETQELDVARGDVVVVTTQLWDNDIRSITSESKRGYDSRDLGRPERMGYVRSSPYHGLDYDGRSFLCTAMVLTCLVGMACAQDPRKLVETLRERGAIIAYGRLTTHPELALDLAASRQKHKTLTNFFVRFEMSKESDGVKFFDLFEGMDQSHFQIDASATRADELQLGPKSSKRRRWVPGPQAQFLLANNIWRAVEAMLLPVYRSTGPSAAAVSEKSNSSATRSDLPQGITAAEAPLSLALTPLGINDVLQIPLEDGVRVAISTIMEFLRGTAQVVSAGGLRLWLYTGSAANLAAFEAELASVAPRDNRLVLLATSIAELCDATSRPSALAGEPISAVAIEIDRRGRGVLKQEHRLLEEATAVSSHSSTCEGPQVGLHARIKAAVTASNRQRSTVAEQSTAFTVQLPPGTTLGASTAIAVRPPSMNADRLGLDRPDALVELRRSWRAVLTAFAAHAGLADG
eukprot:COSAG02_NODE_427_length_22498_cov_11.745212_2_plen_785_part_00